MTAATFDTYAVAQTLRNAGFSEPQAAAAVAMVRDAMAEGVATKTDIGELTPIIHQVWPHCQARAELAGFTAEI